MKTYPEMAADYMKNNIMENWDEYMADLNKDYAKNPEDLDESELEYWLHYNELDSFLYYDSGNEKEMVLANIEYVFNALDMHRDGMIDDEEIVDYICDKNWSQLDCEARFEAVDDAREEVAKWFKSEIKKRNAKETKTTTEYIFVNFSDSIRICFYDLTEFQLYQIMKNNPEFILSGINRKVK